MTFVYEHISEEDKQQLDLPKLGFHRYLLVPSNWVIDRELDAFLIWISPDREPPHEHWYAFWWQGTVFSVAILQRQSILTTDGKRIIPVKFRAFLPLEVLSNNPELKNALVKIEEAIKVEVLSGAIAAGWGHDVSEVQVEYREDTL